MLKFLATYKIDTDDHVEFFGPSPFYADTWSKEDMETIYNQPWYVEHEDIPLQAWKVLDIFGFQLRRIHVGAPIYIIAIPCQS